MCCKKFESFVCACYALLSLVACDFLTKRQVERRCKALQERRKVQPGKVKDAFFLAKEAVENSEAADGTTEDEN